MEHELSQYAADVVARRGVREEWLRRAFENPQQVQREAADPAMVHHPRRIGEAQGRVWCVLYNETVSLVRIVSVFFDRRMRDKL